MGKYNDAKARVEMLIGNLEKYKGSMNELGNLTVFHVDLEALDIELDRHSNYYSPLAFRKGYPSKIEENEVNEGYCIDTAKAIQRRCKNGYDERPIIIHVSEFYRLNLKAAETDLAYWVDLLKKNEK